MLLINHCGVCLPVEIAAGEDPVTAAQRELLEETDCVGGEFALVQEVYEYVSKDVTGIMEKTD